MAFPIHRHASISPLEDQLDDVIPCYRNHLERCCLPV